MHIDAGAKYEYRLMRMYFYMGYFTRRGVTVKPLFGPSGIKITDIDVLGLKFLTGFRPFLAIGECKSGSNVGTIDRFLWMRGLSDHLKANETFIAKNAFSNKTNEYARRWGIVALDNQRIEELENLWIQKVDLWIGSHDYQVLYVRHKRLYDEVIKKDDMLTEVFRFVRSEFWYTENTIRLKRSIALIDGLATDLIGDWDQSDIAYTKRWLVLELAILLSISILGLCHQCYPLSKSDRKEYILQLLAAGLIPMQELIKIRKAANRYVYEKVKALTGHEVNFTPEASKIPPPEYSDALIDIVERLLAREQNASKIPRLLDLIVYEALLKKSDIDEEDLSSLFEGDLDMALKLAKNILFFLFDHTMLSRDQIDDLVTWSLPT